MEHDCGYRSPARLCDQDELRLGVTTALASIVVGVGGILRNAHGEDSAFDLRVAATADRVETVVQQNIGAGHIVHAQAYLVSGTNVDRGIFVNARIVREAGATDLPQFTLFSGYLDQGHQPSFPFGKHHAPLEGPGRIRSITGTNPAAGVEISETVPTGALWKLISWRAQLVTDATVATRGVHLVVDDGTTILRDMPPSASQAASLTRNYNAFDAAPWVGNYDTEIEVQMPHNIWMPAGYRIRTLTTALQAGDNFGAPQLSVEEWLVP